MINQTISHYRITGRLGSGGMGVVYEAEDLTLGRKVALKFLPPQLSREQNSLDRFLLEARTASALNHPNICTIYAVENAAGASGETQSFIAMELLDGQSLDHKLLSGLMPIDRLLEVAIQLADALDAAHSKGIIHRDIKPANIFLTQRAVVKVLDFGLAKLMRPEPGMETIGGATQDSPNPAHLTSPGATVGTISYMSPEQARGEDLDTRTALFSLGTVIYQMATGKMPFTGMTSAVIFHAILELDPVPALQLNSTLPPKLQEIIEKLLEKDRDLRYQSAADLRGDLKRLKRDVESGRKTAAGSSLSTAVQSALSASPSTGSLSQAELARTSSGSAVAAAAGRHKLGASLGVVLGVAVLLAAAYGIYSWLGRNRTTPFQNFSVNKVTETGDAALVAISPDGKYILTLVRSNGLVSLSLRNVPTNSITQVEPPADVGYNGLRFSPDGNYLYFVRSDPGNAELQFLYRAPVLGGVPERLAEDVDSNITFSPDGSKIAFMRYDNPDPGKYRLIVRSMQSGEETTLSAGPNTRGINRPAWSPDGRTIVCDGVQPGSSVSGLVAVDVSDGKQRPLFNSGDSVIEPLWIADGRGLLVLDSQRSTNYTRTQIAFVSYPEGKPTPFTRDTNSYSALSLAATGQVLATILTEQRWNLIVAPSSSDVADAHIVAAVPANTNLTWTLDGRIIDDRENALHWTNVDSGAKGAFATQENSENGDPSQCAGGRYVVFLMGLRCRAGTINVWRADASGGNLKQLSGDKTEYDPFCAPDSKWVYYLESGTSKLWRVSIDGGPSQKVSDLSAAGWADVSPDGATASFATVDHAAGHQTKIALIDANTGATRTMLPFEKQRVTDVMRFSRDGKGLIYAVRSDGVDNLWQQSLDGSPGKQFTSFKTEHIWDFRFSPDGRKLELVHGHNDSDVVLMRDMQQ